MLPKAGGTVALQPYSPNDKLAILGFPSVSVKIMYDCTDLKNSNSSDQVEVPLPF